MTMRVAGEMMRLASDAFFAVDAALRRGKGRRVGADPRLASPPLPAVGQDLGVQALLKARPAVGDTELERRITSTPDADGVDRLRAARRFRGRGSGDAAPC